MKHTQPTYLVSLLAALIVLTVPLHVCAQEQRKTAWGEPDLAGAYTEFTIAPLERPEELGTKEYFTPAEAEIFQLQRLEEVNQDDETEPGTQADVHYDFGTYALSANEGITSPNLRTSIIIIPNNGRIPPLVPAAITRRDARGDARLGHEFDGPENRSLTERCIVWPSTLPPILPGGYNSNLQIFQSPGYVIIQGEMGDPRIIPTDGRIVTDSLPQWIGNSTGRWEGATLVIETTGFNDNTAWRNATANMHVTEWLTRLDDDTVEYRFRVEDPQTWAEPWEGVYPLTNLNGLLFEYACTEGNYGMANILSGERAVEQQAEKQ